MRARRVLALIVAMLATFVSPVQASPGETWQIWYAESFNSGDVAMGGWDAGPYTGRISAYDGMCERGNAGGPYVKGQQCPPGDGPVVFDKNTLSVHDGALDIFVHKRQLADGSWQPVGGGFVPLIGGKYVGLKYGRINFSMGMFPTGPDRMNNWWFAGLLWPEPTKAFPGGDHCAGEVDFPEMVPGDQSHIFHHLAGNLRTSKATACTVNPLVTCFHASSPDWVSEGWHEYRIDWRPDGFTFYRDRVKVGATSCAMPQGPMMFKGQAVSLNKMPSGGAFGHIMIDWIEISKWYG